MDTLEEFTPYIFGWTGTYSDDFGEALHVITRRRECNVAGFLASPVHNYLQCGMKSEGHTKLYQASDFIHSYDPKALMKLILHRSRCKILCVYSKKANTDGVSQHSS